MKENPDFLKKKYNLHTSEEVEKAKERSEFRGEKVSQNPREKIQNYLDRFNEILDRRDDLKRERGIKALKKVLIDRAVVKKEDIPESVYLLEQRIAREQGHGDIGLTDDFKEKKAQEIISNQKNSLDKWIDYLASSDAMYPDWAKYWVIRSVLSMGKFEKEELEDGREVAKFSKRDGKTVAPFAPLNPRALALSIGAVEKSQEEKLKPKPKNKKDPQPGERRPIPNESSKLNDDDWRELVGQEDFAKLYTQFLLEIPEYSNEGLENIDGEWVKYEQGSKPDELVKSLEGYPLEWCTANPETARTQLQGGDFYVYYSINADGEAKIPRVAIRMEDDQIAEVRGIAADQNMDPYINPVVEKKMEEFPDGEQYQKKSRDMKSLTEVEQKQKDGLDLNKEDLLFLYEIDDEIEGFGIEDDPRVKELIKDRDVREDLAKIFDVDNLDDIVFGTDRPLTVNKDTKVFYGDFYMLDAMSGEDLLLPPVITGLLSIPNVLDLGGLELPKKLKGLDVSGLTTYKGLKIPDDFNGSLWLSDAPVEYLELPEAFDGSLHFINLTSASGLKLPRVVKDLFLNDLVSCDGLELPERINGDLNLNSVEQLKDFNFPPYIKEEIYLMGVTKAENVRFPEVVYSCHLGNLVEADNIVLPKKVKNQMDLGSLKKANDVVFPEVVEGDLDLSSLEDGEGIVLPRKVDFTVVLDSLKSAKGLKLPEEVERLLLRGLETLEGFELPSNFRGLCVLPKRLESQKEDLLRRFPNQGNKFSFEDIEPKKKSVFEDILSGDDV